MRVFQSIYDFIKGFRGPAWLRDLLAELQTIIWQTALEMGKDTFSKLEGKILEVASSNMSNSDKLESVVDYARTITVGIKDRVLYAIVTAIVLRFKNRGYLK